MSAFPRPRDCVFAAAVVVAPILLAHATRASQSCESVVVQPNGTTVTVDCKKSHPSPSPSPTPAPTSTPTVAPTATPTPQPTATPTVAPTATPTIAPTDTPIPSPTPSQAPAFYGCTLGDPWTTDISQHAVLPNSAAMLQAVIDAGGGGGFSVYVPTNETMNVANNATPVVPVHSISHHTMPAQPWQDGFVIEPLSDAHALVVQTDTCQYYELYEASWTDQVLSAYGGYSGPTATWTRPSSGGCSTATCIPIGFVAIRPEELAAGYIGHVLGWDAKAKTLGTTCVSPAAPTDCTDGYAYGGPPNEAPNALPYGQRVRLKASFDDSSFTGNAKTIAEALKRFGAVPFDTGCCGNEIVGVGTLPVTSAEQKQLGTITPADLEATQ